MHPVVHLFYYGSVSLHFGIASHPMHIIFRLCDLSHRPITDHPSREGLAVREPNRFQFDGLFHQLDRRYFKRNSGTLEMPRDWWFGSFDDGTSEATERTQRRQWHMHRAYENTQHLGGTSLG